MDVLTYKHTNAAASITATRKAEADSLARILIPAKAGADSTSTNPYTYNAECLDVSTNLQYLRARYVPRG